MVAELAALPVFAWLVTYALHSTLLLALAWLVTRRLDARALALRERLWKFAVLGGFATAALQVGAGVEPLLGRVEFALAADGDGEAERAEIAQRPPASGDAAAQARSHRRAEVEAALAALASAPPSSAAAQAEPLAEPRQACAALQAELEDRDAAQALAPIGYARRAPVEPNPHGAPARDASPRADGEPALARAALAVDGDLPLLALGGWLLAGLASAALVAFGLGRLRRELAGAFELEHGDEVEALTRLAARARLARPVRLLVAPRLAAPLSTGWLRPRICLPPRALEELSRAEFEAVLAHEVAHLARRDPPWLFLLWLIETVCFFQPLNRLARRELSTSFELSADAWAARATGDRLALAACLARIAGWIVGERAPGAQRALGAAMADALDGERPRSRLGERILRLLDARELARDTRPSRAELPLGLGLLGALALAVPGAAAGLPAVERAALGLAPGAPAEPEQPASDEAVPPASTGNVAAPSASTKHAAEGSFEDVAPETAAPAEVDSASTPSEPAAEGAQSAPGDGFFDGLDEEMSALSAELELLRQELGAAPSDPRWSAALSGLESRALRLEDRRKRMQVVLEALLAEEAARGARRFGP